jgi:hypothetical protein
MRRIYFLLAVLLALTALGYYACVRPPNYPDAPVITYMNMSKNVLKQGKHREDSLTIRFSYTDGDGDLGFPSSDPTNSIFIVDDRDTNIRFQYQLPYIEPQGTGNGINGEISVVIPNSCCIYRLPGGPPIACDTSAGSPKLDTIHYMITIRDRAGHYSNQIKTDPITLICHN